MSKGKGENLYNFHWMCKIIYVYYPKLVIVNDQNQQQSIQPRLEVYLGRPR